MFRRTRVIIIGLAVLPFLAGLAWWASSIRGRPPSHGEPLGQGHDERLGPPGLKTDSTCTLRVRVVHESDKSPVPGARIEVDALAGRSDALTGTTDAEGRCTLPVPAGSYRVAVCFGQACVEGDVLCPRGASADLALVFRGYPIVNLRGVVRSDDGRVIAGASVFAMTDENAMSEEYYAVEKRHRQLTGTSDAEGRFDLKGSLLPWRYVLISGAPGFAWRAEKAPRFELKREPGFHCIERDITLDTLLFVDLAGRLFGADGQPLADQRIVVRDISAHGDSTERIVSTDADGRFAIRAFTPKIRMTVVHPRFRTHAETVDIDVARDANKRRELGDTRLRDKTTALQVRLSPPGRRTIRFIDVEEGSSFGSTHFDLETREDGTAIALVETERRYTLSIAGQRIDAVSGCVEASRPLGRLQFPESGGALEVRTTPE